MAIAIAAAVAVLLILPGAGAGNPATVHPRPPSLDCDSRDYVTNLRSDFAASSEVPEIVHRTPAAAVAAYLDRPTLPGGPSGADWALHEASAKPAHAYYVTRAARTPSRILGVIGLERINTSWEVYVLRACGEYLHPGSLDAAGGAPGRRD